MKISSFPCSDLNPLNDENKSWSKCQFECVQAFSQYTQGNERNRGRHHLNHVRFDLAVRRSSNNGEMPIEFYDHRFPCLSTSFIESPSEPMFNEPSLALHSELALVLLSNLFANC